MKRTQASRRNVRVVAAAVAVIASGALGCSARRPPAAAQPLFPRQALIEEIQALQQDLGLAATDNFHRYSNARPAIYRCYFTGILELPDSYERLGLVETDQPTCTLDGERYDTFFYAIEAVASGASAVSPALAEASLERVLVLVPHEDFHNQPEAAKAGVDIAEAAATLIGFLTAKDFASLKYGEASPLFERLSREADLFLQKSTLVNAYYDKLAEVYRAARDNALTREQALARKAEIFATLGRECAAPTALPVSFNGCPAVLNNAGLAFDRTYTRFYPALYDIYTRLGRDTSESVAALRHLLAAGPRSEAELNAAIEAVLSKADSPLPRTPGRAFTDRP